MPRAKLILQSDFPYNINARCINRDWFHMPMPHVWQICCEELTHMSRDHGVQLHSFVLMTNHFHLIASTPRSNIDKAMQQFMVRTSRRITRSAERINQTYAGRHFKCILQCQNYFLNAYKYNYRNPVAAGICERVDQYQFSTLYGLFHPTEQLIPLHEDLTFLSDPLGTLNWLNQKPEPAKLEGVRFGLKRQFFRSKKCPVYNRPLIGDYDIL